MLQASGATAALLRQELTREVQAKQALEASLASQEGRARKASKGGRRRKRRVSWNQVSCVLRVASLEGLGRVGRNSQIVKEEGCKSCYCISLCACIPSLEHWACMPSLEHWACLPSLEHWACMLLFEHWACMPSLEHWACMLLFEHWACMPLFEHWACMHALD